MCGGVASANTIYGTGATATGNDSVAIGDNAKSAQYSVSIGTLADTTGAGTTRNVAIGYRAKAEDDGSISIGSDASTKGNASIAIGQQAQTGRRESIAMGYAVRNAQDNAISIGSAVTNYSDHTVAIGHNVNIAVGATNGTAIGVLSKINGGLRNTSIGYNNYVANGGDTSTFGSGNKVAGTYTTVIGTDNNYGSNVSVANRSGIFGYHNILNATSGVMEDSYIIGANNEVNARKTIVLGNNITVPGDMENAVVLGDHSNSTPYSQASDVTVGGVTLESIRFAGNVALSKGSILSIGSIGIGQRQIKNVAAGVISATSTDAVNGSQLYEAVRAVTAGASPDVYMHVNDGTSTQGAGNASTNLGKANEKGGATGMYSIAIGQNTKASGTNSIVVGPGANSVSDNVVVVGSNSSGAKSIGNNSSGAVLVGQNSYIADDSSASSVLGTGISLKGNSSVAIGSNSSVYGAGTVAINGIAGRANGIAQFKSDSAVAINGAVKGSGNIAIGGVVGFSRTESSYNVTSPSGFTKTSQNSVAVGNNTLVTQSNTVMVGSYDKLYDAKANPDKSKVITPAEHTLYYTLGGVNKQYYEGTLSNSVYLGHESYAFTPDALVDDESHLTGEQSIHTKKYDATGNIVVSNNTTGGAFGKVSKATINGDEITGFAGTQSVGAVTIGAGDYERRIQNVAAGEVSATSTDGINGSQLYAVANTLSKNMSSYMHINDGTGTQTVGNATTNYGYSGSKAGATGTKSIAGGVNAQAAGEKAIAIGADATASGEAAIAIGKSVTTDSDSKHSIAMGETSNITGTVGAVVLGQNSSITSSVPGGPANKTSTSSLVIGRDSHITDSMLSVAIGSSANISQTQYGVAIGSLANITNSDNALALGAGAKVTNATVGIAIGGGSEVTGNGGIAIGVQSKAFGYSSISIGIGNEVKGNKSSAIGDPSYIDTTATGTHVQGNDNGTATNPIKASESTFMGNTNLAGTAGTTGIHVVGNSNTVDSSNVMVMGNNVTVGTGLDGAVVLGHASSADQYAAATDSTINGVTFEAAGYAGNTGLNNGSIVSVGATGTERQIKNVAAGAVTATSTDAVNGSQLYKTAETILKMPINMAGDSGDTVGLKLGKTVNIKGSVASGADVTDGNIAVVGDKATSTLSLKMAKNLTGLTSGTFTDASGNQTVINGAGVTVTPTGTGATPISITTSGINAGNQEIKGVKRGTTDDAAVNKKQMDDALAGISSTLTINDGTTDGSVNLKTGKLKVVGESGANSLVTTTVSGDTINVGTSTKLQNAVTAAEKSADKDLSNLSITGSDKVKTLAQDAVKVAGTGLATVSDATAAGVKTYTVNVEEGKLVIDDTTGKVGAAGSTQGTTAGKNGVATTQDVASVVNSAIDKTKQALTDAKHDFAGDDATVISRKHGEQLNIKGGASTTATDLTSGNIAVVGDTTTGTLNIKLAKALTGLTSATYTDGAGNTQTVTGGSSTISDAAGNSTVVSKGGVTTTDAAGNTTTTAPTGVTVTPAGTGATPISVTTSGISAGNKEIKNVANGTTDDAAVNKKQMDDALKGATDNTVSLGSESGSTTAKKLSTTGGIKFNIKGETGANALITTSATGDDVTIAPTAKLTAAVTAAEKSADKDLSNISTAGETVIKNLAATSAQDAVKVSGTGLATVTDSTTGGVKTYNVDVKTGNLVVTAAGQVGANGTTGAGGAAGADGVATTQNVASAINDAITKSKTDTAQAIADAEHKFDGDTGTTSVRKHGEILSIKGGVTTPADLTTGNIGVVSDGAGTLNIRLAKVLSGLTSASFTTAGGDTTMINGGGVTITPSAAGASSISMTTAGINAGNKEIKGVANATSADAAVNKGQLDAAVLSAAGGALSIEKVEAGSVANGKLAAGDNNLASVSGLTGTAKNETYTVTVSENAVKAVAQTAAQDAVKVAGTGLATVSDATAAGVKTYTVNVDEGKLVIDDTTGKVGAAGSTQGTTAGKNGVATTQDVASVVNSAIDKTKQALTDAKHDFAGDDATVISRKHGEQLNIKGGASTTATDLTSGNIAVVGDTTTGTLNIKLAKALTGLTSATYTDGAGNTQTVTGGSSTISDAAGNSTVVSKGGVTTTDAAGNTTTTAPTGVTVTPAGTGATPISVTTSGISAGNKEIKNVANGTTDDAAVNKKQMDDALKGATDNTVSLGSESGSTTAKKLSTTGGIKFNIKGETGANALITTSATGDDVTIAPTAKLTAAVTAAENAANKDLSNLSTAGDTYIKNLAKSAASWNVETNGGGTTAVAGGDTVNFINGDNIAITNTGRAITIGTAKNVSFDKVTVGGTSGIVIDGTTKQIGGLAAATANDQAVNKGQMDTAIANAQTAATSTEKVVAKALTGDTNLATVTGQTGNAKGETYEVSVSENAVKAVAQTAAQDAVKVAGTGLATVSDATAAGVKTYTVNVDEGKLVIDDTTGKVGAAGSTQGTTAGKNGVATTQDVASVVNSAIDKTKQALTDAKHDFAGDDATVISRKHGEQLNIKGGASTTATDLTSGNIAVVGDTTTGTLNIKLAKALTGLTSATYTDGAGNTQTVTGGSSTISDAAGNSTVVSKGGVTTTDAAGNTTTTAPTGVTVTPAGTGATPISVTTSGISAGNKEIKNVANGTTDDAAVNKKQMDDALKGATDNTVSLGSESGSTTAKKLSTTGGIKFNIKGETGANALITTSATGDDVTIAPTAKLTAAVTAAENAANKDLSNLNAAGDTYIKNLAKSAASWNVETNGSSTTAVAGGDTVNFINGDNIAITNTGRTITIGTAKNVSFDKVTVGGIVLDKNTGINAGGMEIKGVANATSADAAVNKGQLDAAVLSAAGGALSIEKVEAGSVANGKLAAGDNNLASVSGLTGTAKNETYTVTVSENAVKAVAQTAAQDAVKVAGTGLATVSDATAAGVKTYTVNVDEGKLVIDDTTGKVGAAGSTQGTTAGKNGVATTQDVASVVNSAIDKTKQALTDAKHDFAGDDATVISRKHGEQLNIKGGASTTATDLTSGNIAVVGDTTTGTLNIKLAKALTGLTSATYTDGAGNTQTVTGGSSTISDAAGNSTVVSKGGVTTTDAAGNTTTTAPTGVTVTPAGTGATPISVTTSGISAGNKEIKNVANGTTDDAAVNKKQMDDALKGATDNTVSLGSESGSTTAKKLSTTGGIKFNIKGETGANALITTSATGDDVTIAPTAKLTAAVTAAEKSADKDLSNISTAGETVIKNLAATSAQDAVKVSGTGLATVTDSTTGGVKTYNVDVKTGNLVVTAAGQVGANGTTGAGGAAGADGVATTQNVASAINDAITKSKTDTAQAIADAEHKFDGDTGTTSVRKHGEILSIKGGVTTPADLTTGNIGVVSDGAGTLNIRLAKVLNGLTSATYTDGAGNTQTVTSTSSTITDGAGNTTTITKGGMTTTDGTNTTTVAPAGVTATDGTNTVKLTGSGIDAGNTQIKNVGKATTDDAAVNKKQMDDAVKAATDSISTLGDNKVSLGSDSGTTNAKKLGTTGGIKFNIKGDTGTNALITTSATGDDVTIAPTAKLTAAVTAAEKSADKDLSNISTAGETVIKNLAATSAQDAVKVSGTGLATVTDSTTGGVKTYNVDVKTGNLVVTAAGQVGANGTTGAGGAAGADGVATTQNVASAINDAITKSKTDTAQAIADAEHKFDGDTGTTSVRKHGEVLSIKGGVTTPADLTTGNIGVVSDGAGTLNVRLAKVLSGLTSASFTTAGGDSTVINGGGVTITPSATGATPISMTTAGINAGNKEIKGVATGTTADAAVNKAQMDAAITAAAGGSLSTEKVVAKTLTGDNNLVTVTGQTGTPKGETYEVAVSENAVKAVAQTAAQDAVKVTGTGLATVTDSTTGGVKTYNVDVKTGNLVVTAAGQVGANGTTGAGGAAGADGVATTQNVASAINDAITKSKTDTAQAIADAEHKFDGDTGTTSVRKHGEILSIKGGVTTPADLTTGNIGVVSDGAGTLNIRLAKVLNGLTSATYTDGAGNTQTVTSTSSTITDGAGNTTTITKGGMTTTDGTNTTTVAPAGVTATDGTNTVKLTGSGIDAGNTQIKNVGKATTDDAAVNKKQMDDAVKAATDSISTLGDNKVSLGSDAGTTTAKKLSTTGGIKFNIKGDTGANALITTSATGDDVTIAPTAKLTAAVTAAENAANKDLSNLSAAGDTYIKNLAKSAASWNVETNGTGTTAVAGGDTVNFINGDNIAITNTGRAITIGTAKNVSFDKVTVGGVVIDKNNGIDAGGKEITNVGPATSGNSAVNKTQMDTAITNAVNKATTDAKHDFGGDDTTVVTRKHGEKLNIKGGASTTAADLTAGNIAVLGDAATGTLNIRMAKALTGLSSATFTTPSGTTVINGGGMTITPASGSPISVTTGGINAGNTEIKNVATGTTPNSAVNKQQMDNAISNATANVGFNTAGNTGTGSVSNGQTLTITGTNGIETSASGQSITVGLDAATRAQINNATTTANNAAKKDLSNIDNAGKQVIKDTAAWNVKVNGAAAETVKGGDTVTFNDGDNIKVTNTGKDITIATKKDVSFDKVTVGNVVIDKNTNRISGLANAANNDEAVNLGQMNAAISTATAGTGSIKYKANGGTQNSVALTTGFDFKGDSNIQITADPANTGVINYKLNPALTGITSISGGTGAPTITLNAGSGSNPGNVSINSNLDMGGKQINNIGAATHAGDAVNKAQMDQALQNIASASSNVAKSYAYKAGAGAAALAALKPIQYDPLEPTQIMAGIGNYKSQTAVALGVAHYTNENTMFNFGVSLDSHDGIVNAGVTHKFGYSPEKKAIPDRYKGGPISSIYVMQDEVTALQAIVQKQAAENEALRQQNEDMQRKVDMILAKIQ